MALPVSASLKILAGHAFERYEKSEFFQGPPSGTPGRSE